MFRTCTKNKIIKSAGLLITLMFLILSEIGGIAYAQTSGGFSVSAVIPDNQIDKRQTYFDLRMKPGEQQEVEVVITNSKSEDITVEVSLNNALTARNGVITYTETGVGSDLLKVAATDVASLQSQQVIVPALSSQSVKINIRMPDEPFDGVILGGIAVTAHESDSEIQMSQGVSLKNTITYVIALKLTENDKEVSPDFDLIAITPKLINYRTAVAVTLCNKAPRIVKGMEIKAQLYRKGSNTVLYELMLDGAEMAPLSNGDFIIDWENKALEPGTYRLLMTADYDNRTWEWDEEFIIGDEINELNKEAVGLKKNYMWLYLLIGFIALLVVGMIAYQVGKRKKSN